MPFALRNRTNPAPHLDPLPGLVVRHEASVALMARLQGKSEEAMRERVDAGHRPYLALLHGEPAAWGWVATRSADIGELRSTFRIPEGERYLWNFVTLASHRGLGIYPRLLQSIIDAESREAERFWIAYAPENHASAAGIRKAGFVTLAALSFDADGKAALREVLPGGGAQASRILGLPVATGELEQCWRCVRAGRGAMSCAAGSCRCDYQRPQHECAA